MKILVLIKPDMHGRDIGPCELLALEAGLVLKEAWGANGLDVALDVITRGPKSWQESLVRALGMGADQAFYLPVLEQDGPFLIPASVTARALFMAISQMGTPYDLILAGVMSQDLMAGQTGPMLAALLHRACATAVVRLDLARPTQEIQGQDGDPPFIEDLLALREMEGGIQEVLGLGLPALVTVQSGFYQPRYPVLSHMLKARKKPVTRLDIASGSGPEPGQALVEVFSPPTAPVQTRQGIRVTGSLNAQARAFAAFLKEKGVR